MGNTVDVVGMPSSPSMTVRAKDVSSASSAKRGIYGYIASTPPKIYATETYSGGFNGCPEQDLIAKNYTGERTAAGDGEALSAETAAAMAGYYQPFVFDFTGYDYRAVEETPTTRVHVRKTINCGDSEILDELTSTLSAEISTGSLRAAVNAAIDDPDGTHDLSSGGPSISSPIYEGYVSYRYTTEDEIGYARSRGTIEISIRNGSPDSSESVNYKRHVHDINTGTISMSNASVSITLDEDGAGSRDIELDATEGTAVWLSDIERDEDIHTFGSIPEIVAVS